VPAGEIESAVLDQLRAVFRQPETIAGTWRAARAEADDMTEDDARVALQQLDPVWDELFPAEQVRIVALQVERVDIGTEWLTVRLPRSRLMREQRADAGSDADLLVPRLLLCKIQLCLDPVCHLRDEGRVAGEKAFRPRPRRALRIRARGACSC